MTHAVFCLVLSQTLSTVEKHCTSKRRSRFPHKVHMEPLPFFSLLHTHTNIRHMPHTWHTHATHKQTHTHMCACRNVCAVWVHDELGSLQGMRVVGRAQQGATKAGSRQEATRGWLVGLPFLDLPNQQISSPLCFFFFVLCVCVCLVGFSLFCFHFSFVLFVCRCTHEIRQGCVLQRTGMGQMATMMTMTASKTGRTTRARRAATSLPW